MTRRRRCGQRKTGPGRNPYCAACAELADIDNGLPYDEWEAAIEAIDTRLDRLTRIHTDYHRRRRSR